jgi:hypothetical protein
MTYPNEIPEQIQETVSDRMPNNLNADDFRLEYNNQIKGYLYVQIPEDDNAESVTLSVVIRAITSYGRTDFKRVTFPEDRDALGDNEYRILFGFDHKN